MAGTKTIQQIHGDAQIKTTTANQYLSNPGIFPVEAPASTFLKDVAEDMTQNLTNKRFLTPKFPQLVATYPDAAVIGRDELAKGGADDAPALKAIKAAMATAEATYANVSFNGETPSTPTVASNSRPAQARTSSGSTTVPVETADTSSSRSTGAKTPNGVLPTSGLPAASTGVESYSKAPGTVPAAPGGFKSNIPNAAVCEAAAIAAAHMNSASGSSILGSAVNIAAGEGLGGLFSGKKKADSPCPTK